MIRTLLALLLASAAASAQPAGTPSTAERAPAEAPLAGWCEPILGMADVEIEDQVWGTEIRLVAKDPANVAEVQALARRLLDCTQWLREESTQPPAAR